ncbi:uncharacterized protein ARMOST_05729 [Armillaria ostoyae]|uniref:Uncharacterized protein n=1 Tax=Armillaria ostoyae TaxID=47428 RepID=A0A284R125_ARMOS|nr:uncharacterized protein ARMOST_05729 [Armillaria ostoyae]
MVCYEKRTVDEFRLAVPFTCIQQARGRSMDRAAYRSWLRRTLKNWFPPLENHGCTTRYSRIIAPKS